MSPITASWLVHGCMRLSDYDEEGRVSLKVRDLISKMYQGVEFRIRSWPQRGFRDTLWWYEKSVGIPGQAASYFLKVDNWRGPNLYVGITVEKAYEDEGLAHEIAAARGQPVEWWWLDDSWDWHRAVASLSQVKPLVVSAAGALQSELFLWLEFSNGKPDNRYYVVKQRDLYWRGGFRPIDWEELHEFVARPRPRSWGGVFIARVFSLGECSPYLEESRLMEVFEALKPIRDLWRGFRP
ncbi:MAG TPA: hypothetical protein ENI39_05795 [Anaerolineae bacterium]|nr:hypothetical protein [Anaerolineae bacterium]